jgi:hypothetical protein
VSQLRRVADDVSGGVAAEGLAGIGIGPGVGGGSEERIIVVVAADVPAAVGELFLLGGSGGSPTLVQGETSYTVAAEYKLLSQVS